MGQEWDATKLNELAATNAKKKQWLLNVLYSGAGDIPVSKHIAQDILVVAKQAEKTGK